MTKLEELEQYAHERNIRIIPTQVNGQLAATARHNGEAVIFIDYERLGGDAYRVWALAHEVAHLEVNALNSGHTPFVPPEKNEYRATKWVIEHLLPNYELMARIAAYGGRLWEVAEDMEVPQFAVQQAAKYYRIDETEEEF